MGDVPVGIDVLDGFHVVVDEREVLLNGAEPGVLAVEPGVVKLDLVGLDAVQDGLDGEVIGEGEAAVALQAPHQVHDSGNGGRRVLGIDAEDGAILALLFRGRVVEIEVFDSSGPGEGVPLVGFVGGEGIVGALVSAPEDEEDREEDEAWNQPFGGFSPH